MKNRYLRRGIILALSASMVMGLSGCGEKAEKTEMRPQTTKDSSDESQETEDGSVTDDRDSSENQKEAEKEDAEATNDEAASASSSEEANEAGGSSKYSNLTGVEKEYYDKLAAAVDDEVVYFISEDFDGDGTKEAFAIVGEIYDSYGDESMEGDVYFVDSDEVTNLTNNATAGMDQIHEMYVSENDDNNIIRTGSGEATSDRPMMLNIYYKYAVTATYSLVCGVRDGKAYEANISRMGQAVGQDDSEVLVIKDCYDHCSDGSGHTWKPYYFTFNSGTGMFDENVGKEIGQDKLLTYEGAQQILDSITADGNIINNIIERDNGIININYSDKDPATASADNIVTFENVTLRVNENKVVILSASYSNKTETTDYKESSYGGTYFLNH